MFKIFDFKFSTVIVLALHHLWVQPHPHDIITVNKFPRKFVHPYNKFRLRRPSSTLPNKVVKTFTLSGHYVATASIITSWFILCTFQWLLSGTVQSRVGTVMCVVQSEALQHRLCSSVMRQYNGESLKLLESGLNLPE